MESARTKFGKLFMEALGTFMLVCTIQVSVGQAGAMAAIAIGVVLITLVFAGGPISGAHYNPAVSLAVFLRGKIDFGGMISYWCAQLAGGWLGALVGGIIGGVFSNIGVGGSYTLTQALLAEVVFTTLLCFVVLGVATNSNVDGNSFFGAAIGLVVMSGAITVGPVSGGAFNPAVAFGLSVAKGFDNFGYVISVMITNLVGGAIAAGSFCIAAPDQFDGSGASAGETTNLV
jgi:aquaporin Z